MKKAHLLMEMAVVLSLLALILGLTLPPFLSNHLKDRVKDRAFINGVKSAILDQRMRSAREPAKAYSMTLLRDGTMRFNQGPNVYFKITSGTYQVAVNLGELTTIYTLPDFKNRTQYGNNGFTINIYKNRQVISRLIYQVGTSAFREEYYD